MEKLDQDLQRRVWQRVQSKTPPEVVPPARENIKAWLLLARENGIAYKQLARQMGSARSEQLHKLEQQSRRWAACARGICQMKGETVKFPSLQPPKEAPGKLLEKCYQRERRLWEEAERCAGDAGFGPVYRELAAQALGRCIILLELMGMQE